ncbi:hypothetical protein BJP48_30865 [Paenibacillus odorifer]|nr:hypothetical protein BJP48_30865 [Paenibacillus odorifer]
MEYPVLKKFRDKGSGDIYEVGSKYEAEAERAADLQRRGFIGKNDDEKSTKRTTRNTSRSPEKNDKGNDEA